MPAIKWPAGTAWPGSPPMSLGDITMSSTSPMWAKKTFATIDVTSDDVISFDMTITYGEPAPLSGILSVVMSTANIFNNGQSSRTTYALGHMKPVD